MLIKEIPLKDVDVSEWNTRKRLADDQLDSTLDDLANSIEKQGLLCPITVVEKPDGRYGVIAGQRRVQAMRKLAWISVTAIVRYAIDEGEAIALSLVENVHRADMNPHDKAVAFKALLDRLGDIQSVSSETGMSVGTIRKYLQLLELAPEIQEKIAAGEVKNTETLARLSRRFDEAQKQVEVLDRIGGLPQEMQMAVIRSVDSNLDNLDEIVDRATETAVVNLVARKCPFDCPAIPEPLKQQISWMIEGYKANAVKRAS